MARELSDIKFIGEIRAPRVDNKNFSRTRSALISDRVTVLSGIERLKIRLDEHGNAATLNRTRR